MSCLSILRLGPFPSDNECATLLRKALLDHYDNDLTSAAKTTTPQPPPQQRVVRIANRYFQAHVALVEIGGTAIDSTTTTTSLRSVEDGIVLVFDALQSNPTLATSMSASFDALDAVHDRAMDIHMTGDLLRLCVGVGDSALGLTDKQYEAEYARRVLWCLDRGYEYIEADLSAAAVTTGHNARDKDGFARIVEAISGTVWSSAVMEKRKAPTEAVAPQIGELQMEDIPTAIDQSAQVVNEYLPPDPTKLPLVPGMEEADLDREKRAHLSLFAHVSTDVDLATTSSYLDDGSKEVDAETLQERRKELEQEQALDELEGSLRQANQLRELSKSGALSDNERRMRAGDAAKLLMNMMGKLGYNESSDEDESV